MENVYIKLTIVVKLENNENKISTIQNAIIIKLFVYEDGK
jgi:hypothetical protein